MLRCMYSAISGMQAFETKLDVVGNNIANVNTTGFKSSRADFGDMLSQTLSASSSPVAQAGANPYTIGGVNPSQVGLGVKVAAVQTLFTQGADQPTGNPTDLAVNGQGLFAVTRDGGQTVLLTRAGDFTVDENNNLVLPDGSIALGFDATSTLSGSGGNVNGLSNGSTANPGQLVEVNLTKMLTNYNTTKATNYALSANPDVQISQDGSISVVVVDPATNNALRLTIGHLALATVSNPSGLERVGDNLFTVSNNSGPPTYQTPGWNESGTLMSGALEMSNVDLTREFTEMIVAQRGFDANSHVIGTANAILNDIVNLKNS
ncbi:MAG: flagellar hook-basal body complex protein [Alicyclobacillaceae bacterium]|nr:flagellar hook-basal body complex protein [Alicyclobacillaceae bacterium]